MTKEKFLELLAQAKEDKEGRLYIKGKYDNKVYFGTITTVCEDIFDGHGCEGDNINDHHWWNDDTLDCYIIKNERNEKMSKEKETQLGSDECSSKPTYEGIYKMEDTFDMMNSVDYKVRFIAEYLQLKIRYEKLKHLLNKWEAFDNRFCDFSKPSVSFVDWLGFTPSCSWELLKKQQQQMGELLHTLEVRAEIEGINLTKVTIKL